MRCSPVLLAISVVLGNVHHVSSEHHEPLLAETKSVWGFGSMHSCGGSVLCSFALCHHFASTLTCPAVSSKGITTQTCASEDSLPEDGSKQPHTLSISACTSPKFGGLHATSTPGRAFVYLIDHVSAAHTQSTHTTYRPMCHCLRSPRARIASTPALLPT